MNYVFILGASDPEMQEIERVLREQGHAIVYATYRAPGHRMPQRVRASQATRATGLSDVLPKDALRVTVECRVVGLSEDIRVDHHEPGDPGYHCGPQDYLKGSSLGQVLSLLELEPSEEQRIIAAADHCPTQAYQGQCPGVDVAKLTAWRRASRAKRRGVSEEAMEAAILSARQTLLNPPDTVQFCDQMFPWTKSDSRSETEVSEASARFGIPFMYCETDPEGRTKIGIVGAAAPVIETWMRDCGLKSVYGNPHRGYAGGYLS